MLTRRQLLVRTGLTASGAALLPALPAVASGGIDPTGKKIPIFDFTDAYYRRNGVDPTRLTFRPTGADPISVVDDAPDDHLRDVRVLLTLPAYDHSGGHEFFTVLGDLQPDAFTADAAGRKARSLAESSPVYVFPERGADPTGVGASRQADVIDLRHGYFSNNPLALWVHVFVNYTPQAFSTAAGRRALARMAARNGVGTDDAPIVRTLSDLQTLTRGGWVTQTKRPVTQEGRWFVCPVWKDPRDGGIADDAFLAIPRRADGTVPAAEQSFVDEFTSLQQTGDWPDD